MNSNDLQEVIERHGKWLRNEAEGERAILSRANLLGANLLGANLSRAYLSRADLRGANLLGANLSRADLSRAYLRDANLRGAYLRGADLSGANLRDANLRGANLRDANLRGANLSGAGVIDLGQRSDGHQFFLHVTARDHPMLIAGCPMPIAGCRYFSISDARSHWAETRPEGTKLGDESRAILDHAERMLAIMEATK